jgi:hypothetical protein
MTAQILLNAMWIYVTNGITNVLILLLMQEHYLQDVAFWTAIVWTAAICAA